MAALSRFLREHAEETLTEWEMFARSLPTGASMDVVARRDHAFTRFVSPPTASKYSRIFRSNNKTESFGPTGGSSPEYPASMR